MRIRSFIKPFWATIVFIVALNFGQVIADLFLPNYMADIVDHGIAQGDTAFIFNAGWQMLVVALLGIACAVSAGYFSSRVALGMSRNLRRTLFGHVSNFSLAEFDRIGTSSLITRTTNDIQQIQQTTFMMLRMMMRAPLMCIGGILMAIRKDGELSLLLLAFLPVMVGLIFLIMKRAIPLFRAVQKKIDQLNLVLRETLVGIRVIRAFSRIGFEKKKFAAANDDLTDTSIRANRMMAILNPSMNFCMNLLTIVIVYIASFRIDKGNLMVGDMMAFIQYAMQIFMSMMMITMLFVALPRAFASAERVREVFNLHSDIKDPEQSLPGRPTKQSTDERPAKRSADEQQTEQTLPGQPTKQTTDERPAKQSADEQQTERSFPGQSVKRLQDERSTDYQHITTIPKGTLRFNHVAFRFQHAENCVVHDISFSANPGETIAIIGGTGAGKTTLLNLIPRYYDVEKGSIEIDGIDIRQMKQADLRELIGLVPQKITLFSGTISENIRIGKQTATDDEIVHACRTAQADEFIEQLPHKYETEIAQGGTNLSGGQKQRISIARAIVRKPQIYLFDDSFSALDFKTDAKVREALNKETRHATVLIVAQRVSSIIHADKILVMENGRIVGEGTHQELLKTNVIYKEIAASQLSEEELK